MKRDSDVLAYLLLLGTVALWGGNWVAVRYVVLAMSPMVGAVIRMLMSGILLLLILKLTTGKTVMLKDFKIYIFLGLMHFGFNFLQYTSLTWTTAINGSLVNATTPIFIILLSRLLMKEKMSYYQLLGVLISFFGVVWIVSKGSLALLASLSFNAGDILIILAIICWSLYTIYSRQQILRTSAVYVSAYATIFSFFYFLPFGTVDYLEQPIQSLSLQLAGALLFTVVVAVFGLIFWNKGVSLIGPGRASIFMNLMPVFTMLFAFLFLGETIALHQLFGGIFVIGGVYLTSNSRFALKPKAGEETE